MAIKAGLVGLPNVGKSTLFNALTKSSAPAENYPFCTIDPHIAITTVDDKRIPSLQKIYNSQETIPATVIFVDIAGLVKGAATGEGLGNQFLSHIREVDLILHVLRCFEDENIIHEGKVDPISDYETIVSELILKDLESIEKRKEKLPKLIKTSKGPEKAALEEEHNLLQNLTTALSHEKIQEAQQLLKDASCQTIPLLSTKKFLVIANVSEDDLENLDQNDHYQALIKEFGKDKVIPVCAKIEHELSRMDEAQAKEFMQMLNIEQSGLEHIIKKTYDNLNLITFFTCGPKEIHAWPIPKGITIRQGAGEIHSDLERGFISSDVFNYQDIASVGSEAKLRDLGKLRKEGQGYIVQDGDIVHVHFNV